MAHDTSPFAKPFPNLPNIAGITLAAYAANLRYKNRDDIMLAVFEPGTTVAGVFTKNSMPGVPVDWCRKILPKGKARALVVNAGISNVFTGKKGKRTVEVTAKTTAKLVGCKPEEVYISSTGVIGQPIPDNKLVAALPILHKYLTPTAWERAARAIVTTDTFAKGITKKVKIGNTTVTINGFAKGSGMIAPDMATMLAFVFTDAKIPAKLLQKLLSEDTKDSFNSITVDSDTSTSDTVLAFATGKAKHPAISTLGDAKLALFRKAFREVMIGLAQMVVMDGEGITKLVKITVNGAVNSGSARRMALAIANSPLVKTAIAGSDANWGRIVAAIGKSGEKANRDKTSIWIGKALIAKNGELNPSYSEGPTATYMKGREIDIVADVGVGKGSATVWTCDLTHRYIDINVGYRS
ncbi:MAG: bifunctional glutamate N-acetyltransferase/amino-acid acetyltransferase ArgJ [Proteobacteria bacterium]|nr:bifunctional glutamate N-acetyltransferase/amino-acid acetyltransferase ArgJ [Pseudomonadota bacterium]